MIVLEILAVWGLAVALIILFMMGANGGVR